MIETREAYTLADEIIAVDGIDGIFVGPSDFSIAWTGGHAINPKLDDMTAAIADIAAKTKAAGKLAAIYCVDPAQCGPYAAMGYRLLAIQNEGAYLAAGAKAMVEAARNAMGQG